MAETEFNHRIYNRMVSRLGYKWEIAKTEDTTINGQPYTLIVLKEKGKTHDCEMKSFVEKGLLRDRKGRLTERARSKSPKTATLE